MVERISGIKDVLDIVSAKTRNAIYILSTSSILTDSIARYLLAYTGVAKEDASEVVDELKSYPIWRTRTQNSWVLDDDVREYALTHLNGNTKRVQRSTLASLKELRERVSNEFVFRDRKDLEYQIARLGLKIEEEQEQSINTFRYFYETAEQFHIQETARVVNLYIEEGITFQDKLKDLPAYLQSAFFMRGMYAYNRGDLEKALSILSIVADNISDSYQSKKDGAVSYHLIGRIWADDREKIEEAEQAYRQSLLILGEINESFGVAQVYHSLGNLLSRQRNRAKDAEEAYRQSISLFRKDNKTFGLGQVYHSLGNLLSKDQSRAREAEQVYRQSLTLRERDDTIGRAQVYHSLGNLLSSIRSRLKEAEQAYRQSITFLEKNDDTTGLAQVYHSLGNLLDKDRSRAKEAEQAYRQSLELYKRNNKTIGLAQVYHSLGNLLRIDKYRSKEAEQAFNQSLVFLGESNPFGLKQVVYHSLGNLLSKDRSRVKEAEQAYRQSLALREPEDTIGLAQVYHSLGNLLSKDRSRAKEAEQALYQSLALEERNKNAFGIAQVNHSLGNLYRENSKRWDEAEQAYLQSLQYTAQRKHLAMVYNSYGKFEMKRGNDQKAIALLRESIKYEANKRYIPQTERLIRELERKTKKEEVSQARSEDVSQKGSGIRVRDVMTRSLVIANPDDSVAYARRMMKDNKIHSILVSPSRGGKLWRIFTETDFLLALDSGEDPESIPVGVFASPVMHTVRLDWDHEKALAEMINVGVNQLPVVDDGGNVVGFINSADLIKRTR